MTCDANLSTPRRLLTSTVPKVACLLIKPGTILNFFKIATPRSTSLMKIRWPPPPSIAMVHRLPLTLSPLQVLPPVASTPGSSSLARPRSPYRFSSRSQRYDQRVASSDIPVLVSLVADPVPGNRSSLLRLAIHLRRGDQPPGGLRRLVGPLRLLRGESPHGEPLRLLRGLPLAEPHRLPRGESPPRGHLRLSV